VSIKINTMSQPVQHYQHNEINLIQVKPGNSFPFHKMVIIKPSSSKDIFIFQIKNHISASATIKVLPVIRIASSSVAFSLACQTASPTVWHAVPCNPLSNATAFNSLTSNFLGLSA